MTMTFTYSIEDVRPYINWLYFFHAWGILGKDDSEKKKLKKEAEQFLDNIQNRYKTRAVVSITEANGDGDDIVLSNNFRMPMLRQQTPDTESGFCLCLSDYVRPLSSGRKDTIGIFAATIDSSIENDFDNDPYLKMLSQTLADRLTEATVEKLHMQVRREIWGYAPDENLTIEDMLMDKFTGIRPAVGYPSIPDTSINFIISEILNMQTIGIRLTENGAMKPHASVSGLMIAHPKARYFCIGNIGEDQLEDYARRRGVPSYLIRKFVSMEQEKTK